MSREIKLREDEFVASMCPLPGIPNSYLVMTTHGCLWRLAVTDEQWLARRLPSKADLEPGRGSLSVRGML